MLVTQTHPVTRLFFLLVLFVAPAQSGAQILTFPPMGDTSRTVTLEGYADIYFGFDFNEPPDANRLYSVSHSRHNETNINLAYLSLRYNSSRARATFTPGFGTYMNANYAAERLTLRNIVEANIGIRPFRKRNIWIDAGVFSSPYTTETAIAHDQLLYTRSFAAEYSPYYLTGIRATLPLSRQVNLYLYMVNGWQVIEDVNAPLSFGSSLEWKPNARVLVNWSTYVGNERSASQPQYQGRYFSDLYVVYTPSSRLTLSADVYAGRQRLDDSISRKTPITWYQANVNGRYYITKAQSIAARAEYFHDGQRAVVVPVTNARRFDCASVSLGYNVAVTTNVAFHAEGRVFGSQRAIFIDQHNQPSDNTILLITGLTAKF